MAGEPSSTHDVFLLDLSESGTTNGKSGDLLKALHDRDIRTITIENEEELLTPGGDEIPQALVTAIQASSIAIVVLTGGYYDVSWGRWKVLDRILEHFKRNPQRIIPVYYVDRSEARADLFNFYGTPEKRKKYRERTGKDAYKLSKVVAQVDKLPGWDYHRRAKNIDEFERKIARRVSNMLIAAPAPAPDDPIYLVGLESRLEELWRLLSLTSTKRNFLVIGFYGMQGIGKSTLARAVYHSIAHLFEVSCFLDNIRERVNSNPRGLEDVQRMLVSQISGKTGIQNVREEVSMHKDGIHQKDVLLILDDVDSKAQLEALGRGPGWFYSPGSRIIITTRDKHLLTCHGNDMLWYDVRELNDEDAHKLLSHRAFEHGDVDQSYTEVLNRAIRYASGLPLVLDMIGSYMWGKSVDECENALVRLERIPLSDIQTIQGALTYNDIQSIQGALTTSQSVSEVSQISLSLSEVSQTSLVDPEGSQTTKVSGVMSQSLQRDFKAVMWRLVYLASSGVGLLCNALSPAFKRLIGGWNPLKLFIYVVFFLGVWAIILYPNRSRIFHRLKCDICYVIFLGISVYSYFYEKAVDGDPEILCLVSNAAFALASLSLSKLFEAGFETGMFGYFLECFTVQLITIDWKLILVAIIFGGPLFGWHFSS